MKNHIVKLFKTVSACGALFLLLQAPAFGAIDQVRCLLWQGDTAKYHTAIIDETTPLRAVITTTNGDPIEYKWIFNDGTPDSDAVQLSGATRYAIATDHTFSGAAGTPITAQLVVSEPSGGERAVVTVTDNYLVKLEQDNIDARVNLSIEKALWYLYLNAVYSTGQPGSTYPTQNGQPCALWTNSNYSGVTTASVVQAFMINNHSPLGNFSQDPYAEVVALGLAWIFQGDVLSSLDVSSQQGTDNDLPAFAEDYDNDGDVDADDISLGSNGIGIQVSSYPQAYEGGMVIDAIITTGTPNADSGRDFDGDGNSDTYRQIVQDLVDAYSWGQMDPNNTSNGLGSWRYDWNGTYDNLDNSCAQWAAIGFIPAENEWGCYVPQWVKNRNLVALENSYREFDCDGDNCYGSFGYSGTGCYYAVANGCAATTPSGMILMIMSGLTSADEKWVTCERWAAENYAAFLNFNYPYGMYALSKAMRLALPAPIETFQANGLDWYYGGVPIPDELRAEEVPGLAEKLIGFQYADGHWNDKWVSNSLPTSWGVIMLKPALFRAAPISCFTTSPNPTYADRDVTFDPFCSDHSETGKGLANLRRFDWDWDNDGTYDETTFSPVKVKHGFPCDALPCSYTVKLRVTDDEGLSATSTQNVDITLPPHPPVADTSGPYLASLCPEDELLLDGTGSIDPNEGEKEPDCEECPVDTITAYDWDLVGPQLTEFDDAQGSTVNIDLSANDFFDGPGMYNIALRVTDNTALAYPGAQQENLTDADFTSVNIYEGCICDITAVPGCNTVHLSWSAVADADEYLIYRSIRGTNTGFIKITATDATTVNAGLVRNSVNYYRVMAVVGEDRCLSKAVMVEADPDACSGNLQVSGGTREEDYVMISLPIDCENPDATDVLGLPVGKRDLRFGTYDPNSPPPDGDGAYIEYGDGLTIERGRAYFILSRKALDITVDCFPASLEQDIHVPLWYNAENQNGWNQIGPPNESDYEWEDLQVVVKNETGAVIEGPFTLKNLPAINAYIDKKLWAYQPDGSYDPNTEILRVKNGYFVKVKQANVWLVFPRAAQLLVDASTHETLLARIVKTGREFLETYILSPGAAFAADDDYPPRPIGALAEDETSGVTSGSCFIASAGHRFPVQPGAMAALISALAMFSVLAGFICSRRKNG